MNLHTLQPATTAQSTNDLHARHFAVVGALLGTRIALTVTELARNSKPLTGVKMDTAQLDREIHKIANQCVSEARAVVTKRGLQPQELTAKTVAAGVDTVEIVCSADAAMSKVDEGTWL
ncbi:hypothetical protein LB577_02955 [Mesorhizobium sp. B283B1A]|uniref:hypothetical protein n=1 Tax=Mesorhizobium TaxID=68287 RepID=UPI001CD07043|nr:MULTISPECIES: hypothetical protein [Mesorhizobium]MCA0045921.1 hypothetical protein [Mesorhizobium sp. B283B1A]UQS64663.1 hypothetical protein M5D98_32255 [Mesorhizobium opportunistum]